MIDYNLRIGKDIFPAEKKDKEELALFWKEIFDDNDAFIRLFFEHVYKPENTLIIRKEGKILAALHFIPYQVKIKKETYLAAYFCGIGTRESARGQGLMRTLVDTAEEFTNRTGYDMCFLIPAEDWLFDVYRKLYFTSEIGKRSKTLNPRSSNKKFRIIPCTIEYYPYFNKKQWERKRTVLHSSEDFSVILKDLEIEGGQAFVAFAEDVPVGMIFAKPGDNETVLITELMFDNKQVRNSLVSQVRDYFHAKHCKLIFPRGLACVWYRKIKRISSLHMTLMLD